MLKSTLTSDMRIETEDGLRFRIPRDEARGMRTDVVVYASEALMEHIRKDLSLEQAMNVATLPGIAGPSLAMPDIHQGYGFPIGGVAASRGVAFEAACADVASRRPATAALHAAEIRKLQRAGVSKSEIARRLQIGRTSVRRILAAKEYK